MLTQLAKVLYLHALGNELRKRRAFQANMNLGKSVCVNKGKTENLSTL